LPTTSFKKFSKYKGAGEFSGAAVRLLPRDFCAPRERPFRRIIFVRRVSVVRLVSNIPTRACAIYVRLVVFRDAFFVVFFSVRGAVFFAIGQKYIAKRTTDICHRFLSRAGLVVLGWEERLCTI
jgi:hypothetical protein